MDTLRHRLTTVLPVTSMLLMTAAFADASPPRAAVRPAPRPAEGDGFRSTSAALRMAAVDVVRHNGGVPLGVTGSCPVDRLTVSYEQPGRGWRSGAFISPLGPEPSASAVAVNGLVVCSGSHQAFVGFTAELVDGTWDVELVPDPAGGEDGEGSNDPDSRPAPPRSSPGKGLVGAARGPAIEGYARYEGQSVCDPSAKPGALALRDLLLSRYPGTRSLGISRPCSAGGLSEHKEGRAFDWGASVEDPGQRRQVESFLAALTATDSFGNRHALARRMGVMYVIWDGRIWSTYRADAGWRSYTGSSRHTDHVHLSLSWSGAMAQTSFWSGRVVGGLAAAPTGRSQPATTGPSAPRATVQQRTTAPVSSAQPVASPRSDRSTGTTTGPSPSPTSTPSPTPTPTSTPAPGPTAPLGGLISPVLGG